jgi:hypothetical protein
VERVVPEGKRVVCAVGGVQALSDGFLNCCPSEMLADTGITASLVDKRVLKRLDRASEALRPYEGGLESISGLGIRVKDVVDSPVTLRTVSMALPFVIVGGLHVSASLRTDSLQAFRAVSVPNAPRPATSTGSTYVEVGKHRQLERMVCLTEALQSKSGSRQGF